MEAIARFWSYTCSISKVSTLASYFRASYQSIPSSWVRYAHYSYREASGHDERRDNHHVAS